MAPTEVERKNIKVRGKEVRQTERIEAEYKKRNKEMGMDIKENR